jgi:hypothetical protein
MSYSTQWWAWVDTERRNLIFKRDATWILTAREFDRTIRLWDFPDEEHPSDIVFQRYEAQVVGTTAFPDLPYGLITHPWDGQRYVNVPPDFKAAKPQ